MAANPIWTLLRDADVDWCASHASLAARHGRRFDRVYDSTCTPIPMAHPAFDGMLVSLRLQESPARPVALPPEAFWGVYCDDRPGAPLIDDVTARTFDRVRALFTTLLGAGDEAGVSNTIGHRWQFGSASVTLTAWPVEHNRDLGPNAFHDREPRLAYGTHLAIVPGFELSASDGELSALETAVPLDVPAVATSAGWLNAAGPSMREHHRAFLRRLSARGATRLRSGCSDAV